jgi:hypothetical protein
LTRYFADAKLLQVTPWLGFDTVDDRLIMVGIFIKIMTKIDHLIVVKVAGE